MSRDFKRDSDSEHQSTIVVDYDEYVNLYNRTLLKNKAQAHRVALRVRIKVQSAHQMKSWIHLQIWLLM